MGIGGAVITLVDGGRIKVEVLVAALRAWFSSLIMVSL